MKCNICGCEKPVVQRIKIGTHKYEEACFDCCTIIKRDIDSMIYRYSQWKKILIANETMKKIINEI